jgi:hypothetical protein
VSITKQRETTPRSDSANRACGHFKVPTSIRDRFDYEGPNMGCGRYFVDDAQQHAPKMPDVQEMSVPACSNLGKNSEEKRKPKPGRFRFEQKKIHESYCRITVSRK